MVVNEELSENVNIAHFHPKQNLASFGLNEELNPAIYVKHFVRESVCPLLFVVGSYAVPPLGAVP